jgi:flagellar basal body rod protein FlgC
VAGKATVLNEGFFAILNISGGWRAAQRSRLLVLSENHRNIQTQ